MMFSFTLRRQKVERATLAEISAAYSDLRDASGEGASTFPTAVVYGPKEGGPKGRGRIGRLSYNGRIWDLRDNLLYDNRVP